MLPDDKVKKLLERMTADGASAVEHKLLVGAYDALKVPYVKLWLQRQKLPAVKTTQVAEAKKAEAKKVAKKAAKKAAKS